MAESFPGGRSHSDNTGRSWVCFRIHAAKTCTEAAATRSRHHPACALLHRSTLPRLFRLHTCFHCTVTSKRHCLYTPIHLRLIHVALFTFSTGRHVVLPCVRVTTGAASSFHRSPTYRMSNCKKQNKKKTGRQCQRRRTL